MDEEKPRELNQFNIDNHDDEIREIKMKKMTKVFYICCFIVFVCLLWAMIFNNKAGKKKTDEENNAIPEEANGELSTEWGSLYFKYIQAHATKTKENMKGYLMDFQEDKVPELVVFEFNEATSAITYILSINNNKVVRSIDFIYGTPQLLYGIKTNKIDGWYMYYFDDSSFEYYIRIDNILNNDKSNAGFKISTDKDKTAFREQYLYVPVLVDQWEIGKDMVNADFEKLIEQYNNTVVVDNDTYSYINEQLELRKNDPNNQKGQQELNNKGKVETISG